MTARQMREVDRIAVEELGLQLVQMMENAGRHLSALAVERFAPERVTVLAGPGGNGGGGLVAARHLANRGVTVSVTLARPGRLSRAAAHQLRILDHLPVEVAQEPPACDLVLDALIGYGMRGAPRGRAAKLIGWTRKQTAPVLSLDVPSGLDATSGAAAGPSVRAEATLTLALPKTGLLHARDDVGSLFVADISIPPWVFERVGVTVPDGLFARTDVVLLRARPVTRA